MKILVKTILVFIIIISCGKPNNHFKKNEILLENIDRYPRYYACKQDSTPQYLMQCLYDNLSFFYNYHLTNVYAKKIQDINDTVKLTLKIDTMGYIHLKNIKMNKTENIEMMDTIFNSITSIIPKIQPAEYKNKKVNFTFNLPFVFTKNSIENDADE